jgi:hypothetical protein
MWPIVLDQKMNSTVFSAVAVSIGYILLGWDFTTVLGNSFTCSLEFFCHEILVVS